MSLFPQPRQQSETSTNDLEGGDISEFSEIFARLRRGIPQILGLTITGAVIGVLLFLASYSFQLSTTSTHVVFSFDGLNQGEYPDRTKFQSDDLRAPDIIAEALKRQGIAEPDRYRSEIRGALGVEGVVPPGIIKERDRLRASGQTPPRFIPDEYELTLTLPRSFPLGTPQRVMLLNEIVSVFRENFERTYINIPLNFGSAFETLKDADFFEYELVLSQEIENIISYLNQQRTRTRSFRSPTTNLTFDDLLNQTRLFSEIQLNEALGTIEQNGLSRNRPTEIIKMDYHLRIITERENAALEEKRVIDDLLVQSQAHEQSYVLGAKSLVAQPRSEAPLIDQGLIDSLMENDSYNMLVRRSLESGITAKKIQAEKAHIIEDRKAIEAFNRADVGNQADIYEQVGKTLKNLQISYNQLISNIRITHSDFVRHQYADVITISDKIKTEGHYRPLLASALAGSIMGLACGAGLSLIGKFSLRSPKDKIELTASKT